METQVTLPIFPIKRSLLESGRNYFGEEIQFPNDTGRTKTAGTVTAAAVAAAAWRRPYSLPGNAVSGRPARLYRAQFPKTIAHAPRETKTSLLMTYERVPESVLSLSICSCFLPPVKATRR